MRTVLVLAAFAALAAASVVPKVDYTNVKTVAIDDVTVVRQHKVLELFEAITQVNTFADYYKIGKDYDIKANIAKYEKQDVVEKFIRFYEKGFLPKAHIFSIFNEKMRVQALALFDLFFYAKDFETLYNTAAWARVHLNEGLFAYTFYVAVVQRIDTKGLVLPAFYEIYPEFYINTEVFTKMEYSKMRGVFEEYPEYGMIQQGDHYYYYANYSDYTSYGQNEFKLAYLTEDIGWNTYYSYFHAMMPFWKHGDDLFLGLLKERRGEIYYYFYQQLLARYYLERLSNGLGEIPRFSWYAPFKYGFRPYLASQFYPFAQRPDYYFMQTEKNLEDLRFVRNYEDNFLTYLEKGQFKAYNQEVNLNKPESINWVGNFWQANPDLYEKVGMSHYVRSYEMSARRILGGAPYTYNRDYTIVPTAMDFYQTSLRDPAFYQIYNKIVGFMLKYKEYLQPYTQDSLHYTGVKINNVEVSKLTTFFEFHPFNATNAIVKGDNDFTSPMKSYMVMQPRLNHEDFKVKINIKSEVEEMASLKIFVGPKYDGKGFPIKFEENWMNFVSLDWFNLKLTKGENVIERSSDEFFFVKDDSLPIEEIYKMLAEKKLPVDMVENYDNLPKRLMLPKGTNSGFPLQFFVVVYPAEELPKELEPLRSFILDDKAFGYPLDRPISEFFWQPNMYIEDTVVYHKGYEYPYFYDTSSMYHSNEVTKH